MRRHQGPGRRLDLLLAEQATRRGLTMPSTQFYGPSGRPVQCFGVDNLAELIDGPVRYFQRAGRVDQAVSEPLHPQVDADGVNLDTALGPQLLDIALRQAISEIPAHGQHAHLRREAGER